MSAEHEEIAASTAAKTAATDAGDLGAPGVLLVDDQPARLLTYESVLNGVGVSCVRALSAHDALSKLSLKHYAVVILDVTAPQSEGFATARLIRHHERFHHTPIIFVTSAFSEIHQLNGYEVGAVDYISVPLVPEILRSKVALLVELFRRRAELERLNHDLELARASLEIERNKAIAAASIERDVSERLAAAAVIEADLHDTRLLRDLAVQPVVAGHPTKLFEDILAAAIQITEADGGTIQMLDADTNELTLAATSGMPAELRAKFERVDASSISSCGLALASGQRTFTNFDVPENEDPDGTLHAHLIFGFKSAQSTPLTTREGRVLGMFSTHWKARRQLCERELRFLDLLARQAADFIERLQGDMLLREREAALRESDRRKNEFIAVLAHELRNPLVPIRNGIQLLKNARSRPDLLESVRPMMDRQIAQMVRLIDDLLDVARISAGKIDLKREPTLLAGLIESAVDSHRSAIDAARISLNLDLPVEDIALEVDHTRIAQVLSNVVHNAAKFTPAGGAISVKARVDAAPTPPEVVITVADTGLGIAPENMPRIFELFAQSRSRSQGHQGGLGIGLAIARRLVEMHGGRITARSAGENLGSEFAIHLPLEDCSAHHKSSTALQATRLQGLRLLIIDDNSDAADSMSLVVEFAGANASVAYSAEAGTALIDEFKPDVVLCDIGMPSVDGYEACRRIREKWGNNLQLIALTGWGQDSDKRLALQAGFDSHLTKPVDLDSLAAAIGSPKGLAVR